MALIYCEICGVLIKGGESSVDLPEGVICESCFSSRKASVPPPEVEAPRPQVEALQFACCYCQGLLRLPAVERRTRVRCPRCDEVFFLHPDGRIESKLQGSRTAIIQKEQVVPSLGDTAGAPQPDPGMKTQPLKRSEVTSGSSRQRAMLEELKPKRLEFMDDIPDRESDPAPVIDTSAYETPSDLLKAEDEGAVELDAEGLRRKTAKMKRRGAPGRASKKATSKKRKAAPPPDPAAEEAKRREQEAKREAREAKRQERERRQELAEARGRELAADRSRRLLRGLGLWVLFLLPIVLGLGLSAMTSRGRGFATRGKLGEGLEGFGQGVDHAVRTLNGFLPEGSRLAMPDGD